MCIATLYNYSYNVEQRTKQVMAQSCSVHAMITSLSDEESEIARSSGKCIAAATALPEDPALFPARRSPPVHSRNRNYLRNENQKVNRKKNYQTKISTQKNNT